MRTTGALRHSGAETIGEVTDSSPPASQYKGTEIARPRKALYQVLLQPPFGDGEVSHEGRVATATLARSREMLQPPSEEAEL
jgi:hypothetical protein